MPQERKFVLRQIAVLTRLGVSVADIERTISFVDQHLPANADAATWIPTAADLSDELISEAAVVDARMAWYGAKAVEPRFKRLLDARETQ